MRRSLSSILMSTSSASGSTATVAAEVWMRPPASVSGTRWTRCTPDSNLSRANTSRPLIEALASLKPPIPVSDRSSTSKRQPRSAGIALIHAEELGGEQRRLLAAGAGADFEDRVALVVRVLGQQRQLDPLLQSPAAARAKICSSSSARAFHFRIVGRSRHFGERSDLACALGAARRCRRRSASARCIPSTIWRTRRRPSPLPPARRPARHGAGAAAADAIRAQLPCAAQA